MSTRHVQKYEGDCSKADGQECEKVVKYRSPEQVKVVQEKLSSGKKGGRECDVADVD